MKKVKDLDELLKSEKFKQLIIERIQREYFTRHSISNRTQGMAQFKKDAFSILEDMGKLNFDDLKAEFLLIDKKQSKLPTRLRDYIYTTVIDALVKAEQHYLKTKPEQIIYQ
jgi:hypothetical protein